ncbi:MAG: peptidylprolyl isomerase [Erysipelotrichaceae bacterium]|nr:peptidylprolyl isomerase [Erysipelotrichaceae bacterium]
MKKICLLLIIVLLITGCNNPFVRKNQKEDYLTGKINVLITVKDYGNIKLELDADNSPITVTNFINLVNKKFYDGLTFHRIIKGFMIQGGDPNHNGTGGSDKTIKGEFSENGITNDISHKRGVISMARSNDMNSASSQFFIVHEDSTFLDGKYAAFGKVLEGMDVVDKIAETVKTTDDNGTVEFKNQPVIESIRVVE